jgi:hypothetical protein
MKLVLRVHARVPVFFAKEKNLTGIRIVRRRMNSM